jgi:hypothetical protein
VCSLTRRVRSLVASVVFIAVSACEGHAPATGHSRATVIPDTWLDLPAAPFVARVSNGKAVLFNRSTTAFDSVTVGCVDDDRGRVHVLRSVLTEATIDGSYKPGDHADGLLRDVNNFAYMPEWRKKLHPPLRHCPPGARLAVTEAGVERNRQSPRWSAEGTTWPE